MEFILGESSFPNDSTGHVYDEIKGGLASIKETNVELLVR